MQGPVGWIVRLAVAPQVVRVRRVAPLLVEVVIVGLILVGWARVFQVIAAQHFKA